MNPPSGARVGDWSSCSRIPRHQVMIPPYRIRRDYLEQGLLGGIWLAIFFTNLPISFSFLPLPALARRTTADLLVTAPSSPQSLGAARALLPEKD